MIEQNIIAGIKKWMNRRKNGIDTHYVQQIEAIQRKISERNLKRIAEYCESKRLKMNVKKINQVTILHIQEPSSCSNLPDIFRHVNKKAVDSITNNCYAVAEFVIRTSGFNTLVRGEETKQIHYGLHYLPIKVVGNSALCVDLTAGHTLDLDGKHYDSLVIHLKSLEDVFDFLKHVYGGVWSIEENQ